MEARLYFKVSTSTLLTQEFKPAPLWLEMNGCTDLTVTMLITLICLMIWMLEALTFIITHR